MAERYVFAKYSPGSRATVHVAPDMLCTGALNRWRIVLGVVLVLVSACGSSSFKNTPLSTKADNPAESYTRPRLYLDRDRLAFLRARLDREPYREVWRDILGKIENYRTHPLPANTASLNDNNIREFGNRLPNLAIAWLLSGDPRYLADARDLMNRLTAMRDWAGNDDIGAAHLLFGMAVAYDWLYGDLDPGERQRYRQRIAAQAQAFYDMLAAHSMWWTKTYLQNHNYTNVMAMAIAGVALLGEEQAAPAWLDAAARNFARVQHLLSPDGASQEGVGYWGAGLESLLKYYLGTSRLYGLGRLRDSDYFRHAVQYRLQMSLPGFRENADYADSARYDWNGPGFILRAHSHLYHDGLGNWLAREIAAARDPRSPWWLARPKYSWLDLVVYDESAGYRSPRAVPVSAGFDNMGIYVIRDAWKNGRFWSLFKAGPSQGERAYSQDYYAGSHIHPDSGQYSIWWDGAWRVQDDGRIRIKRTHNHNVLLFNGIGQLGGGASIFRKGQLRARHAASKIVYRDIGPDHQYVVAEIAGVYPPRTGLKSWLRSYVSFADGVVVIRDDVRTDRPVRVESLVHLSARPRSVPGGTLCLDPASGYALHPILPPGWETRLTPYRIPAEELQNRGANVAGFLVDQVGQVQATARILDIYTPGRPGCRPGSAVRIATNGDELSVTTADGRHYRIDFAARTVRTRP